MRSAPSPVPCRKRCTSSVNASSRCRSPPSGRGQDTFTLAACTGRDIPADRTSMSQASKRAVSFQPRLKTPCSWIRSARAPQRRSSCRPTGLTRPCTACSVALRRGAHTFQRPTPNLQRPTPNLQGLTLNHQRSTPKGSDQGRTREGSSWALGAGRWELTQRPLLPRRLPSAIPAGTRGSSERRMPRG